VSVDDEEKTIDVTLESLEEDSSLSIRLTRELAAGLAIAIVRLVDAGRPLCPLCGGPLDAKGHDCPRTNGHNAPIR
jgi:hypothetical protein